MVQLRDLFRNSDATEFCIVTIPTQLAVAETRRLLSSLQKEGIAVRHMVVNKLVEVRHGAVTSVTRLCGSDAACTVGGGWVSAAG